MRWAFETKAISHTLEVGGFVDCACHVETKELDWQWRHGFERRRFDYVRCDAVHRRCKPEESAERILRLGVVDEILDLCCIENGKELEREEIIVAYYLDHGHDVPR